MTLPGAFGKTARSGNEAEEMAEICAFSKVCPMPRPRRRATSPEGKSFKFNDYLFPAPLVETLPIGYWGASLLKAVASPRSKAKWQTQTYGTIKAATWSSRLRMKPRGKLGCAAWTNARLGTVGRSSFNKPCDEFNRRGPFLPRRFSTPAIAKLGGDHA